MNIYLRQTFSWMFVDSVSLIICITDGGEGGGSGHEAVVQMSNEPTTDQCRCLRQKHVAVIC